MNLSEPFIRRPVMTTIVMTAILAFGIMSYSRLPVSDLPSVEYPTIVVSARLPGANPETMANTVASPLENTFSSIAGLETMTSSSSQGSTSIILQFNLSKNIHIAAQDVQAAIATTLPLLPSNLPTNPTYRKVNPSQSPIIYLILSSESMNPADLYQYANTRVGQRLSSLPGVAQVQAFGSPYAVRVQVDPKMMANRKVDLNMISNTISQGNARLPVGSLSGSYNTLTLESRGNLNSAEDYASLIVDYRNGVPIFIDNLGRALNSVSNDQAYLHYLTKDIDKPTVLLAVSRLPGANTVQVATDLKKFIPQFQNELPHAIDLQILFDKSLGIKESVADIKFTLMMAFILVVLVIYLYLGKLINTVIPCIALPISIIGTFAIMYFLDFSIDNLSLLALTLSIGFIVDDAIVVLENIVRYTELEKNAYRAALLGSRQISFTVLSMTLSLSSVFIPLLFMSGLLGRLFNEFAVTIVTAVLFSGLISLTLTPMLCSRFVSTGIPRKAVHKQNPSERMNAAFLAFYLKTLKKILPYRKTILGIGLFCLAATVVMFNFLPRDFLSQDDVGFIVGFSQASQDTSGNQMKQLQGRLNNIIRENPAVKSFVSSTSISKNNEGFFFINLGPSNERKSMRNILTELRSTLSSVPGINVYLKTIPLIDLSIGSGSKGDYQYTLQSLDSRLLYETATAMHQKMQDFPDFTNISSNLQIKSLQLAVSINRDQASTYGLTAIDIETALQLAYSGGKVTTIETPTDQYDVILELLPAYRSSPSALNAIYIKSPLTQDLVPLSSVASWKEGSGPFEIHHLNQIPAVTISFNLKPGIPLGNAVATLEKLAKDILPSQVTGHVKGTAEAFQSIITNMIFLTVTAVLVIYLILGILYESFILPFTILSALPIAVFGALATLVIFGEPLSLYGMVGLILLVGIVQKNGIMMVDHANHVLKAPGKTAEDAIIEACSVRFRPIMMTTIAAIMGALPIALGIGAGAAARKSLGLVIVGGLVFSQLVTLYLTPIVFLFFENLREYFHQLLSKRQKC